MAEHQFECLRTAETARGGLKWSNVILNTKRGVTIHLSPEMVTPFYCGYNNDVITGGEFGICIIFFYPRQLYI